MSLPILPDLPALDTFGAPKENFGLVVDPDKVVTAAEYNALVATVVALSLPATKVWVAFSATGALVAYGAVWGNAAGIYAPVSAKTGTGVYTVQLPLSVPDVLDGTMRAVVPKGYKAASNTANRAVSSTVLGANNIFTITLPSGDGAFTLDVYW